MDAAPQPANISELVNTSPGYLEALYERHKSNPNSFGGSWRRFFEQQLFSEDGQQQAPISLNGINKSQSTSEAVVQLINAYRHVGHLFAQTNPLQEANEHNEAREARGLPLDQKGLLDPKTYGLNPSDEGTKFEVGLGPSTKPMPLASIVKRLRQVYASHLGAEFMHCPQKEVREWVASHLERHVVPNVFAKERQIHIYKKITEAYLFEHFLQNKYLGQKRFSLEGLESVIPGLDELIQEGASLGVKEFVLGMAHRGRLNVLANIFNKRYEDIFTEFEGGLLPNDIRGDADVKYHLGQSVDLATQNGHEVHLSMMFNPSHLEAINAVVEGMVYGKCEKYYQNDKNKIVPILIHGDAAVSGQGIVYEVLNTSSLRGYSNEGTIHIVLNNQVGFTAEANETRSSNYCTDVAKLLGSPIFHVNADEPLTVVFAMQMAMLIRQRFKIHVWVDLVGYRRYGHNETDEPRFTQGKMYRTIDKRPNVKELFAKRLTAQGLLSSGGAKSIEEAHKLLLKSHMDAFRRKSNPHLSTDTLKRHWKDIRFSQTSDFRVSIATGVRKATLDQMATQLTSVPSSMRLYGKLENIIKNRRERYFKQRKVDWAMAEQLAYGSLLLEGKTVRLSGQDSQRGTFAHRHAVWKDLETNERYIPLNHLSQEQHRFYIYNSALSEYGVLGFEYGYSLSRPKSLTIWEAQFGDFANGAQIIIDQFISSAETKWHRLSGLVLYLPHGYEGQGPEHSSARIERFLTLSANNNMYVTNPTTAANLFHLLRRQVLNDFRIPLVVFTPKSLLRYEHVYSPTKSLTQGRFLEVIEDPVADPKKIRSVLMCSGKVYYDLLRHKNEVVDKNPSKKDSTTLVRFEQLYPIDEEWIRSLKDKYSNATTWVWVQEEPINMGAWRSMKSRLEALPSVVQVSRAQSSSPATGLAKVHQINQERLIQRAFELCEV